MDAITAVRRGVGGVRWFLRGLVREDAYERYCAHVTAAHPQGPPPMTEREFWRDVTDRQESNPQGRCC